MTLPAIMPARNVPPTHLGRTHRQTLLDFTGADAPPTGKLVYAAHAIRQGSNRDRRAYRGFSRDSDISIQAVPETQMALDPGKCCEADLHCQSDDAGC